MAQWSRQFSGHTHRNHVEDLEETLRAAGAEGEERPGLAARLLSARRHQLRTQLLAAQGGSAERHRLDDLLAEFGRDGGAAV